MSNLHQNLHLPHLLLLPNPPIQPDIQHDVQGQSESQWNVQPEPEPTWQSQPETEPAERHQPEPHPEVEEFVPREKPTTGSRVSWGYDRTHEYEVPSSSEQDPAEYEVSPFEESPREPSREFSQPNSDKSQTRDFHNKPSVGADIDFAATVAAATAAAGFDSSVVTNDPKPEPSRDYRPSIEQASEENVTTAEPEPLAKEIKEKDLQSTKSSDRSSIAQEVIEKLNDKSKGPSSPENSVLSMPGGFDTVDDFRDAAEPHDDSRSVFSAPPERESSSKSKKSRRSTDFDIARDIGSSADVVSSQQPKTEKKKSRSSRSEEVIFGDEDAESAVTALKDGDTSARAYDDDEKSRRRSHRSTDSLSSPDDAKSIASGYEDDEENPRRRKHRHRSRDGVNSPADDDARSITSAYDEDGEKSRRRRHRHRSGDSVSSIVDDDTKSVTSSFDDGEKSRRRRHHHRSSTGDSLNSAVEDDARSVVSAYDGDEKHRRRRHHHRSSTGGSNRSGEDETASVTSSPARIDETRKRGKDEKEKSGGILRSLFGSKASAASASGNRSRSPSLDKYSSRKAMSEVGEDESSRRRKRSSRHSSRGSVGDSGSDRDSIRDDTSEYKKERKSKEERRRHRYEEIVDSGSRRDSSKV
ncbi:hypothetical protein N7470_001441 [Penicillium chermesinum]|nr:hypothetical protein N7470_001441 [Penicillium chermesinum]